MYWPPLPRCAIPRLTHRERDHAGLTLPARESYTRLRTHARDHHRNALDVHANSPDANSPCRRYARERSLNSSRLAHEQPAGFHRAGGFFFLNVGDIWRALTHPHGLRSLALE